MSSTAHWADADASLWDASSFSRMSTVISQQDPAAHGDALAGHRQGDHHPGAPGTLLGVAELAQYGIGVPAGVVLPVHMERGGGRILIEDQVDLQIEKIGNLKEDGFLDLVDVIVKSGKPVSGEGGTLKNMDAGEMFFRRHPW